MGWMVEELYPAEGKGKKFNMISSLGLSRCCDFAELRHSMEGTNLGIYASGDDKSVVGEFKFSIKVRAGDKFESS